MAQLDKVSKLARVLGWLTVAGMILLPLAIIVTMASGPLTPEALNIHLPVSPDATATQILAAVGIGLINPIILIWTLNEMRKLFASYSHGEVLTDRCARLIQHIGQGFLALAIANFVLRPVQMVLLTMANPLGERVLAIGFNSDMIFFGLSGGLIIVIGWAMRAASEVAAENRAFV